MKKLFIIAILFISALLSAAVYEIELSWDEFGAECNGFLVGNINNEQDFVQGIHSETALNQKMTSYGETSKNFIPLQRFRIDSESGYFSFWIRDKFADDDLNIDLDRLSAAKPLVKVFKNGALMKQIQVPADKGMVCKVFNLDAADGEVDEEISFFPRSRMIIGSVIDCVNGEPLSGVEISLTGEMGEVENLQTDADGFFMFPCEIGIYELTYSKEGYIGNSQPVVMGIDESPREFIIAMSEKTQNYRIVLTWGSRPRDLDAHLSGPNPEGGDFHIWWNDHYPMDGKDFLDRDDRHSFGPETITIYKPAKGVYKYSVYNYSHRSKKNSRSLMRSSARVDVYGADRLIKTFNVPQQRGNCWHVFEIDQDNNIILLNEMTDCDNDKNIHN